MYYKLHQRLSLSQLLKTFMLPASELDFGLKHSTPSWAQFNFVSYFAYIVSAFAVARWIIVSLSVSECIPPHIRILGPQSTHIVQIRVALLVLPSTK